MKITEKAAYLRGLVEGQEMDPEAGEGKLWRVLSELVSDLASELTALKEEHEELSESVEDIEIGMEYLEDLVQDALDDGYGEFDDDDDDEDDEDDEDDWRSAYPFAPVRSDLDDEDDPDGDEDDGQEDLWDGLVYTAECPSCGSEFEFDESAFEVGFVICPSCGESFELVDTDEEDEDGSEEDGEDPEADPETTDGESDPD